MPVFGSLPNTTVIEPDTLDSDDPRAPRREEVIRYAFGSLSLERASVIDELLNEDEELAAKVEILRLFRP